MSAMDPIEWELRVQLAAAYRIIDHLGWSELIWTHTTVRVPGPEHHFLINPYGLRFDEVTASNLVKVDMHGQIIGDQNQEINPAGFVIHSAIHMARPDVRCVMHTHTTAGMAIAALEEGLLPISMYALGYYGEVGSHDFEGPSLELDERARLAENLGNRNVMVLKTHGLLTCGATVGQAFVRMFRLQRACEVQLAAQSTGAKLVVPPAAVCERSKALNDDFESTEGGDGYSRTANPEFDAMLRLMDRKDPSFRN
ncbi:class II aldolase/adducin family protein [Bryobacter aggregatus]|uniref:class II aldolase/adducin family protein n=1 Tax=Bryobacter aggregatus TaxID=360054 RepID=UPI00056C51E7|nr:class II aldolase/adducin family protein [Bryobacter aggregatus]